MSDIDLDELRTELDGFAQEKPGDIVSAREQRVVAGFEEIERFVAEHSRLPRHGEDQDIFERLYAVRLDRMRESAECRAILSGRDARGLLNAVSIDETGRVRERGAEYDAGSHPEAVPSDAELLSALRGDDAPGGDVTQLTHVRSREEIRSAEEIAQRNPCQDFDRFRPIFEKVQAELESGERQTIKYQDNAEVQQGDLFILDGQKIYVAEMGELFVGEHGRPDRRVRGIYDNGTESDLLVRSLQRALNKDKVSRRITNPNLGPLFADNQEEDDLPSGYIYVLQSKSENPFVAEHRTVIHKIGVTGGDIKARIANAKKDPTYLLADVEVVSSFKLANINRKRLEALLHRFFANARLDLRFEDRFGIPVEPREWFLVPLPAIEEAVQRLQEGTIESYRYDRDTARIVKR